ncbi:MAG: tetratricopeptide repeat protein [Phycisphaerales bacterium]|nr:tetratricopeptide repeat protein [Phycisphaerales bacterium]
MACLIMAPGMGWTGCDLPDQSTAQAPMPAPEPTVPWSSFNSRVQAVLQAGLGAVSAAPDDPTVRLRLAQLYHGNGLPRQAIETYQQSLDMEPGNSRAWYGLALLLTQEGRIDEAIDAHLQVSRNAPDYAPAIWHRGYLLLDLGRHADAELAFRATMDVEPTSPAARVGLARTALSDGRPGDAVPHLESLRAVVSNSYLDFLLGQAYRRQGRIEEAALLLANVKGDPPQFEDPWHQVILDAGASTQSRIDRIDRLIDAGNLRDAMTETRSAIEDEPENLVLLNRLSHLQAALGQQKACIRTLKRALRIDEAYAPTHLSLSYQYQASDDRSRARAHAQRATELNPNMAQAHMQLGILRVQEQDLPQAIESFDTAFALGIQDTAARHQYAHALTRTGRFPDALKQYQLVLALNRNDGRSWAGLADVYLLQNNLAAARDAVQRGLARAPDSHHLQTMAQVVQERIQSEMNTGTQP